MEYRSNHLALDGLLMAAAICVNQLEGLFPYPLPGVKLGLSNAFGLAAFALSGFKDAAMVSIGRVVIAGLAFTGFGLSFLCSAAGVVGAMMVLLWLGRLYPEDISLRALAQVQAMAFNLAQLAVASSAVGSKGLFLSYLPIMGISSLVTGFATGTMAGWLAEKAQNAPKAKGTQDRSRIP